MQRRSRRVLRGHKHNIGQRVCNTANVRGWMERATWCILGFVDGDGGAGQGHAAGVLQGDVDAVGARLSKASLQTHLALRGRRDVVARDGSHLGTAGVRHDGAGGGGDAADKQEDGEFKTATVVLPGLCCLFFFFFLFKNQKAILWLSH